MSNYIIYNYTFNNNYSLSLRPLNTDYEHPTQFDNFINQAAS